MRVAFKRSFVRDLEKIRNQSLKDKVRQVIELLKQADNLQDIPHIRKLRGSVTTVSGLVTTGSAWQWTGMGLALCDSYTAEMPTDISLRGTSYGCRGVNPSVVLFLKSGQPN